MKIHLLSFFLLLVASTCFAQNECVPTIKLRSGYDELAASSPHDKLPPLIRVEVESSPTCQNGIKYEIFRGTVYIIKHNQLVDEQPINLGSANITRWQYQLQPGDRISFKVTHMFAINAKGDKKPITKTLYASIDIK